VEGKSENPLLNLELFKSHEFSYGLAAAYLSFTALNSTMLFIPFYLQDLLKFGALKAGLIISAYPITMAVVAPISGWLSDRITYRPLTVAGMGVATAALLLLATLNRSSPMIEIVLLMVLLGGGLAIFQSPNNSSIMGSVPRPQLGIAGGTNALFRNLGMVSGTTISVLIFSFSAKININTLSGNFNGSAFVHGLSLIFIFDAVCTFVAVVISLTRAVRIKGGTFTPGGNTPQG
jgi:MFS family permease